MAELVREIPLSGFDSEGEPVIRVMDDGTLYVVFEFMPPSFAEQDECCASFDDFDKQLERAIGVPVLWEDREFFLIPEPTADTIEQIRRFVENYRRT